MESKDKLARVAGALYLLLLPTAGPAFFLGRTELAGDPGTAFALFQETRSVIELMILAGVVGFVDFLILALFLYWLFRPVGQTAAGLMLALVAVSVPVSFASLARRMDVLSLLDASPSVGHLPTNIFLAWQSADDLMLTSVIFWGLWLLPLGWLVIRCGFVPRILGILLMLGSLFYLVPFPATVLTSHYSGSLLESVVGIVSGIPDILGELGLGLWLLIKGAGAGKAGAATAS